MSLLQFHQCCRRIALTYLYIADDLLVFPDASLSSHPASYDILYDIYWMSSLQFNAAKTKILFPGIPENQAWDLLNATGLSRGVLPFRYLGIPLIYGHLSCVASFALTSRTLSHIIHSSSKRVS